MTERLPRMLWVRRKRRAHLTADPPNRRVECSPNSFLESGEHTLCVVLVAHLHVTQSAERNVSLGSHFRLSLKKNSRPSLPAHAHARGDDRGCREPGRRAVPAELSETQDCLYFAAVPFPAPCAKKL